MSVPWSVWVLWHWAISTCLIHQVSPCSLDVSLVSVASGGAVERLSKCHSQHQVPRSVRGWTRGRTRGSARGHVCCPPPSTVDTAVVQRGFRRGLAVAFIHPGCGVHCVYRSSDVASSSRGAAGTAERTEEVGVPITVSVTKNHPFVSLLVSILS